MRYVARSLKISEMKSKLRSSLFLEFNKRLQVNILEI